MKFVFNNIDCDWSIEQNNTCVMTLSPSEAMQQSQLPTSALKGEQYNHIPGFYYQHNRQTAIQLVLPLGYNKMEKVDALLLLLTQDEAKLLGKQSLPMPRLGEWVTNLVNRALEDSTAIAPQSGKRELPQVELTNKGLALGVVAQLELLVLEGLNPVYRSHAEFLTDLVMDLPWNEGDRAESLGYLMESPEFQAASAAIEARGGPSYFEYFKKYHIDSLSGHIEEDEDQLGARWNTRF